MPGLTDQEIERTAQHIVADLTDRGKPLAKIVPLRRNDLEVPAHLLQLERQGAARIGTGTLPEGFLARPCPKDREGRAVKALLEEREGPR